MLRTTRFLVRRPATRLALNLVYSSLDFAGQRFVQQRFARLFRGHPAATRDGRWRVPFAGKVIDAPLRAERLWLDWDQALSLAGHDAEVKQTYEALIHAEERPELFIDVGANYGLHSLLFLVHGIEALTIEPNVDCAPYFKDACVMNGVTPKVLAIALGDQAKDVELVFRGDETWLGATREIGSNEASGEVVRRVPQQTLDGLRDVIGTKRVLLKIDVEGNELSVLRGGNEVLRGNRPKVIFESRTRGEKALLFDLFVDASYGIHELPWSPDESRPKLGRDAFLTSTGWNFLAVSV